MRSQHEVCREISEMQTAELAQLHGQVKAMAASSQREAALHKFIMLLGLINKHKERRQ